MSSTRIAAVLAASALVGAGCGGSSPSTSGSLTRAELIAKADVICARVHVEYHANGYTTKASIARLAPILAGDEQTAVDELRGLRAPASMVSDWNMIIDNAQTTATDTAKLGQLAKEGKFDQAAPLFNANQQNEHRALAVAARDGFKECATAS
ncbi:MAG: hypothetical protein ACRDK4_07950 [Solirubrobacteraceae bacterium]